MPSMTVVRKPAVNGAVVSESTTNLPKEATMNNQTVETITTAIRNMPVEVEASNKPLATRHLEMLGQKLEVRIFSDFISFGPKVYTTVRIGGEHKQDDGSIKLEGPGRYSGILSALHTLMSAKPHQVFMFGFHVEGDLEESEYVWKSSSKAGEAKVHWGRVSKTTRAFIEAEYGLTQQEWNTESYWSVYTISRGKLDYKFQNVPQSWQEFLAEMKEKGIVKGTPKWEEAEDNHNHRWNSQNKHDGIDIILGALKGVQKVGVDLKKIARVETLEDKFSALFYDEDDRVIYRKARKQHYDGRSSLRKEKRRGGEPVGTKTIVYVSPGQCTEIEIASLVGRDGITLVRKDGSKVKGPLPYITEDLVEGLLKMAAATRTIIKL